MTVKVGSQLKAHLGGWCLILVESHFKCGHS